MGWNEVFYINIYHLSESFNGQDSRYVFCEQWEIKPDIVQMNGSVDFVKLQPLLSRIFHSNMYYPYRRQFEKEIYR